MRVAVGVRLARRSRSSGQLSRAVGTPSLSSSGSQASPSPSPSVSRLTRHSRRAGSCPRRPARRRCRRPGRRRRRARRRRCWSGSAFASSGQLSARVEHAVVVIVRVARVAEPVAVGVRPDSASRRRVGSCPRRPRRRRCHRPRRRRRPCASPSVFAWLGVRATTQRPARRSTSTRSLEFVLSPIVGRAEPRTPTVSQKAPRGRHTESVTH